MNFLGFPVVACGFLQWKNVRAGIGLGMIWLMAGCYSVEQSTVERGYRWVRRGETDRAISTFQYAVRKFPDSVMAHVGLGDALFEAGKDQEAIEAYTAALARLESSPPTSRKSGEVEIVGNPLVSYQNQGLHFPHGLRAYLFLRRGSASQAAARTASSADRTAALQRAAADYETALEIAPNYTAASDARKNLPKN